MVGILPPEGQERILKTLLYTSLSGRVPSCAYTRLFSHICSVSGAGPGLSSPSLVCHTGQLCSHQAKDPEPQSLTSEST